MGPFKLIRGIRKRRKKDDDDDDDEEEGGISFPIIDRPTPVKDMLSGMSKRKKKSEMIPGGIPLQGISREFLDEAPEKWASKLQERVEALPSPFQNWITAMSNMTGLSENTIRKSMAAFKYARAMGWLL